jgi:hypothetical protein
MLREYQQILTTQYVALELGVINTPEPVFLNDGPHPSVPGVHA